MQKLTGLVAAGLLLAVSASGAMAASPATAGASTTAASSTPASSPHHAMMHSKHVKAIQAALNQNGEQLSVDGKWGPKTHGALMDFQQKNGLKATGHADKATMQKLNIAM
jgi:peptidoglycan DL-endopeptidase CwlO